MLPSNWVSDYVTIEGAAAELRVTDRALRKAISDGRLAAYEVLGGRVLLRADLARYRLRGWEGKRPSIAPEPIPAAAAADGRPGRGRPRKVAPARELAHRS